MDFYKNVLSVIYQDALKIKNGYLNGIFHGDNGNDPKFVGKAWLSSEFHSLLGAIGQWCSQNEDKPSTMPDSFLPEYNPYIDSLLNPEAAKNKAAAAAASDDEAHV